MSYITYKRGEREGVERERKRGRVREREKKGERERESRGKGERKKERQKEKKEGKKFQGICPTVTPVIFLKDRLILAHV